MGSTSSTVSPILKQLATLYDCIRKLLQRFTEEQFLLYIPHLITVIHEALVSKGLSPIESSHRDHTKMLWRVSLAWPISYYRTLSQNSVKEMDHSRSILPLERWVIFTLFASILPCQCEPAVTCYSVTSFSYDFLDKLCTARISQLQAICLLGLFSHPHNEWTSRVAITSAVWKMSSKSVQQSSSRSLSSVCWKYYWHDSSS